MTIIDLYITLLIYSLLSRVYVKARDHISYSGKAIKANHLKIKAVLVATIYTVGNIWLTGISGFIACLLAGTVVFIYWAIWHMD